MQSNALKIHSTLAVPTAHETASFLLASSRNLPELLQEWDEEEDLTNVIFYSPTSD
jgi:hypothetical protein